MKRGGRRAGHPGAAGTLSNWPTAALDGVNPYCPRRCLDDPVGQLFETAWPTATARPFRVEPIARPSCVAGLESRLQPAEAGTTPSQATIGFPVRPYWPDTTFG